MRVLLIILLFLTSLFASTPTCLALNDGAAEGTFSIDNIPTQMKLAVATESEGLFDPSKKDLIITISDRSISDTSPDDKVDLSLKARKGDLTAISIRLTDAAVTNVSLFYKELNGTIMLPGNWFSYTPKGPKGGRLELVAREFDGHTYTANLEFQASEYKPLLKKVVEEFVVPTYPPTPTLPPASTSFIQKDSHTALLVAAIMQKDEEQAVKIINIGIDPNSKDQYGIPILNWAVMTCLPKVVQAIVNKKPDLTYERAPGMTIMTEAGACPEAQKILKSAGAK